MCVSLRREHHWLHVAPDVYDTVRNCSQCTRMCLKIEHQRELELFQPAGPFEFVALDILGPLPKTKIVNQFVAILTDRYSKLTSFIPTAKMTSTKVAHIFFHDYVILYGIPNVILLENGPQFVSKFFKSLCTYLGVKKVTVTVFYLQTNRQVDRYNKTLVSQSGFLSPTTTKTGTYLCTQ